MTETMTGQTDEPILCQACQDDPYEVICPSCHGWTCQDCPCEKPECDTCDNTGKIQCEQCYEWT